MYWMLLPPSANAGRRIEDDLLPLAGSWAAFFQAGWDMVMHLLVPNRR